MIKPIAAIANRTMMSNPIAVGSHKAYQESANYAFKGQKLNIDCNEMRSVSQYGKKLDIMA